MIDLLPKVFIIAPKNIVTDRKFSSKQTREKKSKENTRDNTQHKTIIFGCGHFLWLFVSVLVDVVMFVNLSSKCQFKIRFFNHPATVCVINF